MSITSSSVICRRLAAVWAVLRRVWAESALGGWCHRRGQDLKRWGSGSWVCRMIAREGYLRTAWPDSLACRVLTGLLNLPIRFVQWLYRKGKGLWDGSVVYRAVAGLGHGAWLLMGLFALVMLAAPHEKWDNVYALLLAVGVAFLFVIGCSNRPGTKLELDRLGPWFTLYLVFVVLGLVCSYSLQLSLRFFLFHLTCFFIVTVTVSAVERYEQLRAMLICAGVGLTAAAIYGCYQGYIGVEVVASQQDVYLNAGMPGRIYSFFDNPNNFAEVILMLSPLMAAMTLNAKGWRGKVGGLICLGTSLAAIGMTYSRSSWLGLALAAVIFLALLNWRFVPLLIVLGAAALPLLPKTIWNRILTIGNMKDTSALYRVAIYEATGRLLTDHGVRGVGLGSDVMKLVFQHYPTLFDGNYPVHTHNNYFQVWGEMGVFGLLAYLAALAGQIKAGIAAFHRSADKRVRRILAAAVGSLCGIMAVGLVEYTWFYPRNMFLFWFLFAVIAAGVKVGRKESA